MMALANAIAGNEAVFISLPAKAGFLLHKGPAIGMESRFGA